MLPRKKKKWPIVVVIIILILLIVGGYFGLKYYQKQEEEKKKQEEKTEVKEEKIALSEAQQNYVLSKISFYDGMIPYGSFDSKSLDNAKALQFIDSIRSIEYVDFTKGLSLKSVNNILKQYFGKDVVFDEKQSTCSDPNTCFVYHEDEKKYYRNNVVNYPLKSKNFYVSGEQERSSKKITITVRQLYYRADTQDGYVVRFYRTPDDAANSENPLIDLQATYGSSAYRSENYERFVNEAYQNIATGLSTITYTFAYQAGGYYLESVVK